MRPTLTAKQAHILQSIVRAVRQTGVVLSIREVCREFDLRSPSTGHQHLEAIRRKGYIRPDFVHRNRVKIFDPVTKEELIGFLPRMRG